MGEARAVAIRRGDVFLVKFDPTIGSEIRKTRPALVLQNDIANQYSPVTIVAAITAFDGGKLYPTEVQIAAGTVGLEKNSVVLLNQVRTVDKARLLRRLGQLDDDMMAQVDIALHVSFGLAD